MSNGIICGKIRYVCQFLAIKFSLPKKTKKIVADLIVKGANVSMRFRCYKIASLEYYVYVHITYCIRPDENLPYF